MRSAEVFVQLGFGFDAIGLPKEKLIDLFKEVKALGIKVITTHYLRGILAGFDSNVAILDDYGLLDSSILFSDATNPMPGDADLIRKANARVSSTPSTEMQMALGYPVAFHPEEAFQSHASIGIDNHASTSASIPIEMRMMLQSSRAVHNETFIQAGKNPLKVNKKVEEVFHLGTVGGARAIGMADKIGKLKEDPVAAVVLHSNPRDVEMVVVDGIIRKEKGKLKAVVVGQECKAWTEGSSEILKWENVVAKLVEKSKVMDAQIRKIDFTEAREGLFKAMGIDKSLIVDRL